jgi:adenine phosphoribosyltransferase
MSIDLKDWVRNVPDHPKPGVQFKDLTPLFAEPMAFRRAINWFTDQVTKFSPDVIAAIDARGFVFASPVADRLGIPLALVRKSGKLPPPVIKNAYSLEYDELSIIEMRSDALSKGQRVVIVDDLLATGGTAVAAAELVEELGAKVVAQIFLVELAFLNGRERILARDAACEIITDIVYG